MPGFVKIGKTYSEEVGVRLGQLYSTGVPFPFDLAFACRVPNADEVERALHLAFAPNRVNPRREFFKIEPDQAIAILRLLHVSDATSELSAQPTTIPDEEVKASENYKARRPNLNFLEMQIPIGSELHFVHGGTVAVVSTARKITIGGEETSLTAATRQLLGLEYAVQPGPYWTFNGRRSQKFTKKRTSGEHRLRDPLGVRPYFRRYQSPKALQGTLARCVIL